MKILFLSRYFYPHIGGVEKHVLEVSKSLVKKGHKVTVLTENYSKKLKTADRINEIKIVRFNYPHIKFIGLLYIWFWLLKNRNLITASDIIHCHDVFVWYLPFRFFFPKKPVYTTFHGWEGVYPISFKNVFLKRISNKLSWGSIGVGKYIEKYYGTRFNKIIYGAA